jgi:hypothetical protein
MNAKLEFLLAEMMQIASLKKEVDESSVFSGTSLESFEIRIGCSTIIDWLYFVEPGKSRPLLIGYSLSNKYFLRFMELDSIKEFFLCVNDEILFSDNVTKADVTQAIEYVKKNYQPQIRRTPKH